MTALVKQAEFTFPKPSPRSLSRMPHVHLDINEKFKHRRLEFDMTQSDWANLLKTTVSTIKQIETGRITPNHHIIKQLALRTGTDLNWLFGTEKSPS